MLGLISPQDVLKCRGFDYVIGNKANSATLTSALKAIMLYIHGGHQKTFNIKSLKI